MRGCSRNFRWRITTRFQRFRKSAVRKNIFYARLRVVEISAYGDDRQVPPLLRDHLPLLHFADAVFRIKYQKLYIFGVLEARKRRFPGVSGCRGSNCNLTVLFVLLYCHGQEFR